MIISLEFMGHNGPYKDKMLFSVDYFSTATTLPHRIHRKVQFRAIGLQKTCTQLIYVLHMTAIGKPCVVHEEEGVRGSN